MAPIATLAVKLQAQIAEFQGEFREAQKDVQKFHDNFEATATKASAMGNLIARGLEIGISAFLDLGKRALESAGKIEDMSNKTGLSIKTIQEFQHVADQTGTTLEAFSTAAFQLGARIAGGSDSVVGALKALGLEFAEVRSLNADQQFETVAQALGRVEDAGERTRLGIILYGRTFGPIAASIAEGYRGLADGADKMADDTVKRLAAAEDAWSKLGRKAVIVSGEVIAASVEVIDRATTSWSNFFKILSSGPAAGFRNLDLPNRATRGLTPEQLAFDEAFNAKFREQQEERSKKLRESLVAIGNESATTRGKLSELRKETDSVADSKRKLQEVIDRSTSGLRLFTGELPGTRVELQKLFDIIPPNPPDLAGPIIKGLEGLHNLPGVRIDLSDMIPPPPPTFWQRWFGGIGDAFGDAIVGLARGEGLSAIVRLGSDIGSLLGSNIAKALTTGANAITGVFGDVLNKILPGLGSLLGPLTEKLFGLFGNKGRDLVKDFAASFGGFDALHARLLEMGDAGEALWIKLTQGVGRNNPEQARQVIAEVQAALDEFGTEAERAAARLDAIGVAIDGVNTKATLFAAPFQALIDKQKEGKITQDEFTASLAALGEKGQAEFERIGVFAAAAFGGMVKETGDAIGALGRLAPAIGILKQGIGEFKLTSTGTIDALISLFDLVHDKTTGPILQSIQATGQIFAGLQDAGILTSELFQTVATDIGAAFRELEAKGGDVAKAMALSQPVLQRLWEAQKTYGAVTDETTRKILEQAEKQGLVGDHMKDVNKQILDVLLAIADVFGAKIPESMRATQRAASDTARSIENEFKGIKIPPIKVPVEIEGGENLPRMEPGVPLPRFGSGGVVTRPMLALVGDVPEAIIPLNQLHSVVPEAGSTTVVLQMDGRDMAEVVVPHIPGVARRYITV